MNEYHYPLDRMDVEKSVYFGSTTADIVISHKDSEEPYIIVEVKNRKEMMGWSS